MRMITRLLTIPSEAAASLDLQSHESKGSGMGKKRTVCK